MLKKRILQKKKAIQKENKAMVLWNSNGVVGFENFPDQRCLLVLLPKTRKKDCIEQEQKVFFPILQNLLKPKIEKIFLILSYLFFIIIFFTLRQKSICHLVFAVQLGVEISVSQCVSHLA